ncbi:ZNF584 isoform 7 [Pan troglodytes]|uniref:Zinc finger protein 584 n=2 Tax=Pan troglodytes TaxID=9598 RepID=A0A2I3RDM2_PANTR|nr:ZNF584 isoform 7 [Pan troglodytes]
MAGEAEDLHLQDPLCLPSWRMMNSHGCPAGWM